MLNFHHTKPGTSLLVALGLTGIIVLVSLGVTTVVISSIRESANVTGANQAYYAAEGALEKGLLINQDKGAGYSASDTVPYGINSKQKAGYTISGQVNKDNSYAADTYGVPTPGTGNAGQNCNALTAQSKDTLYYDPVNHKYSATDAAGFITVDPQDNPCNWNKIKIGETISIPLYVTKNIDGVPTVVNPTGMGLSSLKIKVRTPCENGEEYCAYSGRQNLYYDDSSKIKYNATNDTIMSWQITGSNIKGDKTYTLSPATLHGLDICKDYTSIFKGVRCKPPSNSEIYEGIINYARTQNNQIVVADNYNGIDNVTNTSGKILDFLKNTGVFTLGGAIRPADPDDALNKPVLKLTVIHSLLDMTNTGIPYLEYQVLTTNTTNEAPTDTSQTVTAEGYSGSFKQVLEVKNPQDAGLLEYVIQQ